MSWAQADRYVSLRGATGSGVGWKPGKGLLGWVVSEAGEKD